MVSKINGKTTKKNRTEFGRKYIVYVCRIHRLINVRKIKLETQFRPRIQNQDSEIKTKRNIWQIV